MNISHESSSYRRPPLSAWRLCLDQLPTLARALANRTRLLAGLLLGAACLTSQATAAITFGQAPTPLGGFEGGLADWAADDSGIWHQAPANASSITGGAREGSRSVQFQAVSNNKRSELTLLDEYGTFNWGTEYWVGFSLQVRTAPSGGNRIIFQNHAVPHARKSCVAGTGEGHCGLAPIGGAAGEEPHWEAVGGGAGGNSFTIKSVLNASNQNVFDIRTQTNDSLVNQLPGTGGAIAGTQSFLTPAYALNTWYDFVVHFKLVAGSGGIMQVWYKRATSGSWISLVNEPGVTVYKYDFNKLPKIQRNYLKFGTYYGPNNQAYAGVVRFDAFRIWTGAASSTAAGLAAVGPRPVLP